MEILCNKVDTVKHIVNTRKGAWQWWGCPKRCSLTCTGENSVTSFKVHWPLQKQQLPWVPESMHCLSGCCNWFHDLHVLLPAFGGDWQNRHCSRQLEIPLVEVGSAILSPQTEEQSLDSEKQSFPTKSTDICSLNK